MIDLLAFYTYLPAAPTLLRLLKTAKDEEILIHLIKAMTKVGSSAAVPRLSALLAHPNWVVRSQSAEALSALRALEAIPNIRHLLDDESLAVRACAQRVLASLNALEADERGSGRGDLRMKQALYDLNLLFLAYSVLVNGFYLLLMVRLAGPSSGTAARRR